MVAPISTLFSFHPYRPLLVVRFAVYQAVIPPLCILARNADGATDMHEADFATVAQSVNSGAANVVGALHISDAQECWQ